MSRHAVHRHQLAFGVRGGRDGPLRAELRFDSREPYAVTISFEATGDEPVEWLLARELLAEGLRGPAGEGDIRLRPATEDPAAVLVDLRGRHGWMELVAPRGELVGFLACAHVLVPPGREGCWLGLDENLDLLLAGED